MRNQPLRIDGVARETTAKLVVDAARRHAVARMDYHPNRLRIVETFRVAQQKLRLAGLWKLRRAAKAAIASVIRFFEKRTGAPQRVRRQQDIGRRDIRVGGLEPRMDFFSGGSEVVAAG